MFLSLDLSNVKGVVISHVLSFGNLKTVVNTFYSYL